MCIRDRLYTEGYTIKGVQKLLRQQGKKAVLAAGVSTSDAPVSAPANAPVQQVEAGQRLSTQQRSMIESVLGDLKDLRKMVAPE